MKLRLLDLFLLVLILIGVIVGWPTIRLLSTLKAEQKRLSGLVGELDITDPTKVYIQAMDTGEPLSFAWRVYLPPNYNLLLRSDNGASSSRSSNSQETIWRVRFREDVNGEVRVYSSFSGGSILSTVDVPALTKLIHGRWDKLNVEQLAAGSVTTLNPDESAVLLRITLPDFMHQEWQKLSKEPMLLPFGPTMLPFGPTMFEIRLGPTNFDVKQ